MTTDEPFRKGVTVTAWLIVTDDDSPNNPRENFGQLYLAALPRIGETIRVYRDSVEADYARVTDIVHCAWSEESAALFPNSDAGAITQIYARREWGVIL